MMDENEIDWSKIELETVCDWCHGRRGEHEDGTGVWRDCGRCGGSGFATTALGEKVLDLIRHNIKRLIDESSHAG